MEASSARSHDAVTNAARASAAAAEDVRGRSGIPKPGLLGELSHALASIRVMVASFLDLLTLEARRAGIALMWMTAGGVLAGLLGVTAWLGFMGAAAFCIVEAGLSWMTSLILVGIVNLLGAAAIVFVGIKMSRDLLFPATRRQLESKPPRPAEA